jgi:hypothetical protein
MPVAPADQTFFTPAKLDHQAYSKPRCDGAAPNVQLILTGLKRRVDHYHYSVVRGRRREGCVGEGERGRCREASKA